MEDMCQRALLAAGCHSFIVPQNLFKVPMTVTYSQRQTLFFSLWHHIYIYTYIHIYALAKIARASRSGASRFTV